MGNNNCIARAKEELESRNIGKSLGIKDQHDFIDALILQRKAEGQQHLFQSFDDLSAERKDQERQKIIDYLTQIKTVDFELVNSLYQDVFVNPPEPIKANNLDRVNNQFSCLASDEETQKQAQEYFNEGLLAVAEGKVAICIMAGGQASRLGASVPKGAFDLKIPQYEDATLFHVFANKIEALERHARNQLPQRCKEGAKDLVHLYVMTSHATDKDTKDYFNSHNNFGLSKNQVHYFQQANLPALDNSGKIILKDEFEIFMAPNGNGGLYDGIESCLPEMRELGIEYIHIVGVDNILNKLGDPIMIGYAAKNNLDFVSKFTKKTDPKEKVGIHVELNQELTIIEYSELSEEQRYAKLGDELKFNQGFLAQFMISRSLMEELIKTKDPVRRKAKILAAQRKAASLGLSEAEIKQKFGAEYISPEEQNTENLGQQEKGWQQYHLAKKNIEPLWDAENKIVLAKNPEPKENGMKFEQFIFDPFTKIKSYALQEVSRLDEFAPIKNREFDPKTNEKILTDNRRTALELQSKLHMKWLQQAGYRFAEGLVPDGEENIVFVDPRLSYFGEGIADGSKSPVITKLPFVLPCNLPKKQTSDNVLSGLL